MGARIVRRVLWVLAFGCLWLPLLPAPPLSTAPYLQDVTTDGITVAMITAAPSRLQCEVRDAAGGLAATVEGPGERRRHALRASGLRPATEYRYSVTEGGEPRGGGSFKTAPARDTDPVRFAFVGDSGGQPWWVWLQTAPAMHLPARWHWLPPKGRVARIGDAIADYGPDFLLHLGDIVYPRGRHEHYSSGFFRPFGEAIGNAPFYFALGNHDVMDTGGLQTLANFHLPTNAITGDSRNYSFAYGPVRIICLDCTDLAGVGRRVEPGHPSYAFLEQQLQSCAEPWIVVASHYPMRSASRQRDRADLLLHLRPLLEKHRASLYLSGHDHCYQRFGAAPGAAPQVPLIVSGGGGKSLYDVVPAKGARKLESVYHWCSVEVAGRRLQVRAFDIEGRQFDELIVELDPAETAARVRATNPARAARIAALP